MTSSQCTRPWLEEDGSLVMLGEPLATDGDEAPQPKHQEPFVLLDGIPQVLLAPPAALLLLTVGCEDMAMDSGGYNGPESMASILLHLKDPIDAAGSIWESEAVQHNGGRPLYPSVLGLAGQRHRQPGAWPVSLTIRARGKAAG